MKRIARKRVLMFLGLMMSIAVVGVGFAAWVITAPTENSTSNGNINVETVTEEKAWSFNAYWVNRADYTPATEKDGDKLASSPTIVFGTPSGEKITGAWLTNDSIGKESLKVYLFVKAEAGTNASALATAAGTVTLNAVIPSEETGKDPEIVELSKYLGHYAKVSVSDSELDSTELGTGVVLTVEFKWNTFASKTENQAQPVEGEETTTPTYTYTYVDENPYTFYNEGDYSAEKASLAKEYLEGLYGLLEGIQFQVLISASLAE